MEYKNIACIADKTAKAQEALDYITNQFNIKRIEDAEINRVDLLIVLGGDGFMLHTLHKYLDLNIAFFGMNVGNFGFLLNQFDKDNLLDRINKSEKTILRPLKMTAKLVNGDIINKLAINEVSLIRNSTQAARLKISVNGIVRIDEMICDGALVSTPAGSSAYNFSVGGPIIPLEANILALTPISPHRPRRWKGALLPHNAYIEFNVLDTDKRPVNAVADFNEVKNVASVNIEVERKIRINLLFDPGHSLEERITKEQFAF